MSGCTIFEYYSQNRGYEKIIFPVAEQGQQVHSSQIKRQGSYEADKNSKGDSGLPVFRAGEFTGLKRVRDMEGVSKASSLFCCPATKKTGTKWSLKKPGLSLGMSPEKDTPMIKSFGFNKVQNL